MLLTWRMADKLTDPFSPLAQTLAPSFAIAETFSTMLGEMAKITDTLFQEKK